MLYYVLSSVYVLICFLLLLVVLLQQGKGGDIASAFGGGGSTQSAFGARSAGTVLTRASAILGALFLIGALALAVLGQRGGTSVIGQ
jgi:preprotein translocase subunit SecG